jgi:hypothetical protein
MLDEHDREFEGLSKPLNLREVVVRTILDGPQGAFSAR